MRIQPWSLAVVFTVIAPVCTFSQDQMLTNCRTQEAAGNFVGPDETIADGMVCKVVKPTPGTQQLVAHRIAPAR